MFNSHKALILKTLQQSESIEALEYQKGREKKEKVRRDKLATRHRRRLKTGTTLTDSTSSIRTLGEDIEQHDFRSRVPELELAHASISPRRYISEKGRIALAQCETTGPNFHSNYFKDHKPELDDGGGGELLKALCTGSRPDLFCSMNTSSSKFSWQTTHQSKEDRTPVAEFVAPRCPVQESSSPHKKRPHTRAPSPPSNGGLRHTRSIRELAFILTREEERNLDKFRWTVGVKGRYNDPVDLGAHLRLPPPGVAPLGKFYSAVKKDGKLPIPATSPLRTPRTPGEVRLPTVLASQRTPSKRALTAPHASGTSSRYSNYSPGCIGLGRMAPAAVDSSGGRGDL